MLEKILDGNIQIIDSVIDWKDSIKIASKSLLEKNIITENYIKAMIESIQKLGFYVKETIWQCRMQDPKTVHWELE